MRWFTRERTDDPNFDDDAWDAVRAGYWAYVDSVRDGLPPDLQRLVEINLHDAVFDMAKIDFIGGTAHIRFLSGDSTTFIDCQYGDMDFGESNLRNLRLAIEARLPRREGTGTIVEWVPFASVLYDEITVMADRFQHSFLVDPLGDFAVSFRQFRLTTESAPEGRLPERRERYAINQCSD